MHLIRPSYTIEYFPAGNDVVQRIERAGRTCYKSEDKITDDSASEFCKMILKRGHLSVFEHVAMTVRFICDRGFTHELVRHRLCAFSQESTRYCNYGGGVTFIIPPWCSFEEGEYTEEQVHEMFEDAMVIEPEDEWLLTMMNSEAIYCRLLKEGWTPQQARGVLPISVKTEIVCTANIRQWLHIFELRTSPKAHPQMRELMIPLYEDFKEGLPELFE